MAEKTQARCGHIPNPGESGLKMFVPAMDPFAAPLCAAIFRSAGFDAHVAEESKRTLAIGMQHTGGGECIPCPSTTGALIHAVRRSECPPEKAVFFMPGACGPCRFGQYACLNRLIFDRMGWDRIRIVNPSADTAYSGLDAKLRMRMWHGVLIADILRKMAMRTRPYEQHPGETDRVIGMWFDRFERVFSSRSIRPLPSMLAGAVRDVASIPVTGEKKPLLGVVGEIYVRCNPFLNNNLCRKIEELGGEAALSPIAEWVLYSAHIKSAAARQKNNGVSGRMGRLRALLEQRLVFERLEHRYYKIADPVLHDRREPMISEIIEAGSRYLPEDFTGESILTLGRAVLFITRDKARAIVNASPVFCMPGTISSSIFPAIEREFNLPVISTFYDGSDSGNQSLVPMMHYICAKAAESANQ